MEEQKAQSIFSKEEIDRMIAEEREKYPKFTEWQLYARVRARIMSEYGQSEVALKFHAELDQREKNGETNGNGRTKAVIGTY